MIRKVGAAVKAFISWQLIAVLMAALVLCGFSNCSKQQVDDNLTRAAKASQTVAKYTGEAITIVGTLYTTGAIKIGVKDALAQKLKDFSISGKDFNDFIAELSAQYKAGIVPANVWSVVTTKFDALTKIFVDLLALIPQAAGLKDSTAFKLITAAIVTLAQILISVGVSVPAWKDIERAVPNWRQLINAPAFRQEVALNGLG